VLEFGQFGKKGLLTRDGFDVAALTKYLFIPDTLLAADIAVVFGMTAWHRPTDCAVQLYRLGLAPKLLFTGGFNARLGTNEAIEMARAARHHGVPSTDIIVEPRSANTCDNVVNSLGCIERRIGLDQVHTVLLIAIHFHARRARLTAEKHFPKHIGFGSASYPSAFYSARNWHLSDRGRADVYSEVAKIETYLGENLTALKIKSRVFHGLPVHSAWPDPRLRAGARSGAGAAAVGSQPA
jgi:uncharacterized SAM-binding protein YcdF (DUF218 family)